MYQKLSSFHLTHPTLIIFYFYVVALIICNSLIPWDLQVLFMFSFFHLRASSFFISFFFSVLFSRLFSRFFSFFFILCFFISYFRSYLLYSCILLSIIFPFFSFFLILYLDGNVILIITHGFPFLFFILIFCLFSFFLFFICFQLFISLILFILSVQFQLCIQIHSVYRLTD